MATLYSHPSEQFEARVALVKIEQSPSILLRGMAGSHMPVAVAHGEGRAEFVDASHHKHWLMVLLPCAMLTTI